MVVSMSMMAMAAQRVADIPELTHAEAGRLAQTEYERVLALLETLAGDDWTQPTYCTEWNVRQMVAHLAGSVTESISFAEFRRQTMQNPYRKEFDKMEDAINKLQVEERADKTRVELVAEFRQNGPVALKNRQKLPWLVRKIHLPMGSMGLASVEYLVDTIYPRDQWMHRYDICAATGKKMVVTPEHDGRIVALVVRDIAKKLKKEVAQRTIALHLTGPIEATYLFGNKTTPDCTVEMDIFDFNLLASGRIRVAEAAGRTAVSGDPVTANWFLAHIEVPY